jgi:hypothetical protein
MSKINAQIDEKSRFLPQDDGIVRQFGPKCPTGRANVAQRLIQMKSRSR